MTETEAKRHAYFHLNNRHRVLAPGREATITYPAFDPCKAATVIARVDWPAIVDGREVTL
jgi:hypothetical protein